MKKTFVVILVCMMIGMFAMLTPAAIHSNNGMFRPIQLMEIGCDSFTFAHSSVKTLENWYTIESVKPFMGANLHMSDGGQFGASYFANEQSFADFYMVHNDCEYDAQLLDASAKMDNGLIAGFASATSGYNDEGKLIGSLGYSFDLGQRNYVAVSADYVVNYYSGDYDDSPSVEGSGIAGYDVDFAYNIDKLAINGQYYMVSKYLDCYSEFYSPSKGNYLDLMVNYGLTDDLTIGAAFLNNDYNSGHSESWSSLGLTYTKDKFTINTKYNRVDDVNYIEYQLGYQVNSELLIGIYNNTMGDKDPWFENYYLSKGFGLNISYAKDKNNSIIVSLNPGSDDAPTTANLAYVIKL